MEFRGTALLNVMSLYFGLFTEGSGWDCCKDRNLSPHNVNTGYEVHTVFCTVDIGNYFCRLKWPPREVEPHLHGVSILSVSVALYLHCRICLRRSVKERTWIVLY